MAIIRGFEEVSFGGIGMLTRKAKHRSGLEGEGRNGRTKKLGYSLVGVFYASTALCILGDHGICTQRNSEVGGEADSRLCVAGS